MREIKFRCWYKEENKMSDPFKLGSPYSNGLDKKYVMQFTGLHDKNGKEIYEGDIVLWFGSDNNKKCIMVVEFKNQKWYPYLSNSMEVIGNIHENPELITV